MQPIPVPDGSFQYMKLGSVAHFFNWGVIALHADQMKRSKNSRTMHMVFHVQEGTLEVNVHDNEFTIHKGGVWHVPRGESHSIPFFLSLFPSVSPCLIIPLIAINQYPFNRFTISLSRFSASCLNLVRPLSLYASIRVGILHVPSASLRCARRKHDVWRRRTAGARGSEAGQRVPQPADCGVAQHLHAQHAV
jgi:hypothetical protein